METSTDPTPDQALRSADAEFHPAAALFPLMDVDGAEFGDRAAAIAAGRLAFCTSPPSPDCLAGTRIDVRTSTSR